MRVTNRERGSMMWALVFAILFCLWAAFGTAETASADSPRELGYRKDTVIQSAGRDECTGTLFYNHDNSFENGYCWQYTDVAPPYYGAWGEGYDLGPVTVECGIFWFTQVNFNVHYPFDIYIWESGAHGPPASVLCTITGVEVQNIGFWPSCSQHDFEIDCCVEGDFTIGYWADFSLEPCSFYTTADETGSGGHPWTCIAPGIGYPSGWQHPNVVYPDCVSLGFGVTVTDAPSPAESETWGAIKCMFQETTR